MKILLCEGNYKYSAELKYLQVAGHKNKFCLCCGSMTLGDYEQFLTDNWGIQLYIGDQYIAPEDNPNYTIVNVPTRNGNLTFKFRKVEASDFSQKDFDDSDVWDEHPYWNDVEYTKRYMAAALENTVILHGFSHSADTEYTFLRQSHPKEYQEGLERFKTTVLDAVDTTQTNVFIISTDQKEQWKQHVEKYDLKKWIIYESPEWAENVNYPGEGRLKLFVLEKPL